MQQTQCKSTTMSKVKLQIKATFDISRIQIKPKVRLIIFSSGPVHTPFWGLLFFFFFDLAVQPQRDLCYFIIVIHLYIQRTVKNTFERLGSRGWTLCSPTTDCREVRFFFFFPFQLSSRSFVYALSMDLLVLKESSF